MITTARPSRTRGLRSVATTCGRTATPSCADRAAVRAGSPENTARKTRLRPVGTAADHEPSPPLVATATVRHPNPPSSWIRTVPPGTGEPSASARRPESAAVAGYSS